MRSYLIVAVKSDHSQRDARLIVMAADIDEAIERAREERGWDVSPTDGHIRAEEMDSPRAEILAGYRNRRHGERACDFCGAAYRGPAVYCSWPCAIADA